MTTSIALAVDVVVLARDASGARHVLLIQRAEDSDAYPGAWALPGGYVEPDERIGVAACRELCEETGLTAPSLRFVGVYDNPRRDPRGRVVSFAYLAVLPEMVPPVAVANDRAAKWVPLRAARRLAFDHDLIVTHAIDVYDALHT